jgi:hypothetical protein
LARSGAVWVIATLRADFWHRAAEIPELIPLAEGHGRIDLPAATAAELAEIIRKPAQVAGLNFETHSQTGLRLDAVLAQDAATAPGALPLLSFALDELYKNAKMRGEAVLKHPRRLVSGGGQDAAAVGRKHRAVDRAGVALEGGERLAVAVPHPRRLVNGGGQDAALKLGFFGSYPGIFSF